jgi:Ser/Thr protein kinase RdoA (MazF antagonist)
MKQSYNKNIITTLFHEYFPKEIAKYALCEGGAENSNFLIETEDQKFILKIFENSKNEIEIVQSEVGIMTAVRGM